MRKEFKICRTCKTRFFSVDKSLYCSERCEKEWKNNTNLTETKSCEYCGNSFETRLLNKKFCSLLCKVTKNKVDSLGKGNLHLLKRKVAKLITNLNLKNRQDECKKLYFINRPDRAKQDLRQLSNLVDSLKSISHEEKEEYFKIIRFLDNYIVKQDRTSNYLFSTTSYYFDILKNFNSSLNKIEVD